MTGYPSIVPAIHHLVKHAPSGIPAKAVAELLGKDYRTLMSELSGQPGHKFGAELVLPVMDIVDSNIPMDIMAEARGGCFVRLPAARVETRCLHRQCMTAMGEFGQLMDNLREALEDGRITTEERRSLSELGYRAVSSVLALIKLVEASAEA